MEQIRNYFNAEKAESLLFIAVGLIAIFVSIYFLTVVKKSYNTGMSIPLITVALIQLFAGTTVYFRSSKDITHVENIVSVDKSRILSEEIPRMKTIMNNFRIYRTIEIILMTIGLILFFVFRSNDFIKGIGFGLFLQAALMLTLDYYAEKRGVDYFTYLNSINTTNS